MILAEVKVGKRRPQLVINLTLFSSNSDKPMAFKSTSKFKAIPDECVKTHADQIQPTSVYKPQGRS